MSEVGFLFYVAYTASMARGTKKEVLAIRFNRQRLKLSAIKDGKCFNTCSAS